MAADNAQMSGALNRIREIAESVNSVDGVPPEVRAALGDIISIARYGFDVTAGRGGQAGTAPGAIRGGSGADHDSRSL